MRVVEGKMAILGILSCGRQLHKWLLDGRVREVSGLLIVRFSTDKKNKEKKLREQFASLYKNIY